MTLQVYQGIDPGYGIIGISEILADPDQPDRLPELKAFRSLKTSTKDTIQNRLVSIHRGFVQVIERHPADRHIIEDPRFFGKAITNSQNILKALGVIHLAYAQQKISLTDVGCSQVKLQTTGNGAAKKSEIRRFTKAFFGANHTDDDALDAIAIAVTGWRLDCEARLNQGRDVDARSAWLATLAEKTQIVITKPPAKEKKSTKKTQADIAA